MLRFRLFVLLVSLFTAGCPPINNQNKSPTKFKDKLTPIVKIRSSEENKQYIVKEEDFKKKNEERAEKQKNPTLRPMLFSKSSGKISYIALLLPLTGKNELIGKEMIDVAIWAFFNKKNKNVRFVPIDTGDTDESAKQAARKAVELGVDFIIGPIFSGATKAITPIVKEAGIKTISLSNDINVATEGVYAFGITPESEAIFMLSYGKENGYSNYGLILPGNAYGYNLGKNLISAIDNFGLVHMTTEYYSKDQDLFSALAKRVYESKKRQFKQDEDGKIFVTSYRDRNKQDENQTYNIVEKSMDAIYIDAKGQDFYRMVKELMVAGFWNSKVIFMSDDRSIGEDIMLNHYAEGMLVAGASNVQLNSTENKFYNAFAYKPRKIAVLGYDAITLVLHLIKKGKLNNSGLHNLNGYNGVYGDFRLTSQGLVQRRFSVYRVKRGNVEMIYKSNLFI